MRSNPKLAVLNPLFDAPHERAGPWVNKLLLTLRPGGTWVVPRSVSTVKVLSEVPPIVWVHYIFPDPTLLRTLSSAGWTIQSTDERISK